jgi:acetyl esterase/lipase
VATLSDSETERPAFSPPAFDTLQTLLPPIVAESGTTIHRDIEVAAPLGFRPLRMDLARPPVDQPVPVVVYIHGGAFMFGSRLRGAVYEPIQSSLLRRGLAVAAVEYRLSGEAQFPACLHDVKAAVRWLRRFGPELGTRPDAVGAWGESAGAHLAAFLALNSTDPSLNGTLGVPEVSADMFASPVSHVGPGAAPMLLVHGLADNTVPYPQSVALQRALQRVGGDVPLTAVAGAGHVFHGVDVAPIAEESAAYLAERLR